jgi:hypothetical protein
MTKYRLIRSVNNANGGFVTYIIEKRVFGLWWSRNYLAFTDGCYDYTDEDKAINMLDILNGNKEWLTEKVIK